MALRALVLAPALGTLVLAVGCGGTPVPGSPEDAAAVRETVRRHEVAVFAGDGSVACGTTVGRAREQLMRFHAQPPSARRPSCEELIQAFDALNTAWRLDCRTFSFDEAAWRRARRSLEDEAPTDDQRLADALIKCRTLIGKTRSEVTSLLGEPDDGGSLSEEETRRELVYSTGPQRDSAFAIDSEWLTILLDRGGRVRSVELAAD